ncbi:MAG: phosphoserine transaminase, partial [Alphaproteobacteria bacterium]
NDVETIAFDSFGAEWVTDIVKQLKLKNVTSHTADYGSLPNLDHVNTHHDVVFPWNGTTSGVRVPHGEWVKKDRKGLTICDATSAAFAMELPWDKLDVVTWSWQKVLGGEAGHGMIALSPRAVERLQSYTPAWPLPKIFRLTKGGKLIEGIFVGETINTPSMLCVADALDGLAWAESIGGLKGLIARTTANFATIEAWVEKADWVDFLAIDREIRSPTSVCLKIIAPWFTSLDDAGRQTAVKDLVSTLEAEKIAFDIASYRDAPAGLRIWCGATVETSDLEALTPWLDWAYGEISRNKAAA